MTKPPIKVLFIDDCPEDREVYKRLLLKIPDHEFLVAECDTAEDGLQLIGLDCPHILLLDYMLPALNGLDFLKSLKKVNYNGVIIMLTGEGDERVAVNALKEGAHDYLVKGEGLKAVFERTILSALRLNDLDQQQIYVQNMLQEYTKKLEVSNQSLKIEVEKRNKMEKSISSTMDLLRLIMDNISDGILVLDNENKVIISNPALQKVLGFKFTELEDMAIQNLIPEINQFEPFILATKNIQQAVDPKPHDTPSVQEAIHSDGTKLPIYLDVNKMTSNHIDFLILTVRNISEQKVDQHELLQAPNMAEKFNQEKSDFITRMSDQLRVPMDAILGFSQLLEDDADEALSAVQKSRIDQIHQAGTHLLTLINDVKDLANIEAEKIDLQTEISAPEIHLQDTYTLLYVESNLTNLNLVQQIVNKKKNIHLLSTNQAKQGIKLARSAKPDLIIMDINMPEMDGNLIFNELQNSPETKTIPVIAISSSEMKEEIDQALQAGFRDCLTKPLKISNFMDILDNHLPAKISHPAP